MVQARQWHGMAWRGVAWRGSERAATGELMPSPLTFSSEEEKKMPQANEQTVAVRNSTETRPYDSGPTTPALFIDPRRNPSSAVGDTGFDLREVGTRGRGA